MSPVSLPENSRILITRTDRIGDLVVSTPVFEALRQKFPKAHLAVCVFREHRELVEGNPFLDEVILYEKKGSEKNWLGQFSFAQKIRRKKFDAVIHLHATNRMHVMSWLAGIPVRIGYDRRAAWALTHVHPYDKKEGAKHESSYLSDLIFASGLSAQPASSDLPAVPVTQKNLLSVKNLLEHAHVARASFVVIHPSASDESKMWPAERFAQFIIALGSAQPHTSMQWITVGDSKASEQTKKIAELSGVSILDFCGQLSLGMLAALFSKATLVISNDSGPAHIAAATGVPTVSIFGRWQPGLNAERWRPLGKKTAIVIPQIESVPIEQRKFSYITDIAVEQVVKAVNEVLR